MTDHTKVIFDHENPSTVHDILWSWSTGYLTTEQVREMMHLDHEDDLIEAAQGSDVPLPARLQAVIDVAANARLASTELPLDLKAVLLEYGYGRMSLAELEAWLQTQLALAVLDRVPADVPEHSDKMPD